MSNQQDDGPAWWAYILLAIAAVVFGFLMVLSVGLIADAFAESFCFFSERC